MHSLALQASLHPLPIALHPIKDQPILFSSKMMQQWRRRRSPGSSQNQRPPRPPLPTPRSSPGPSDTRVPAWEIKFCTTMCIPWEKLCKTKLVMPMYENVVKWNDSAAMEAFENSKARFWAQNNKMPCNIPLPDPEMYIDEVEYDAVIDPKLVVDLEKRPPPSNSDTSTNNAWNSSIIPSKPVPASGWWDAWDSDFANKPIPATRWGKSQLHCPESSWNAAMHLFSTRDKQTPSIHNCGKAVCSAQFSSWSMKHKSDNAWSSGGWKNAYGFRGSSWGIKRNSDNAWSSGVRNYARELRNSTAHGIALEHDNAKNDSWVGGQDNSWRNGRNGWSTWENKDNDTRTRFGRKREGGCWSKPTKSRYKEDNYQRNNRAS